MKILSPGHRYELANFENTEKSGQVLQFIEKMPTQDGKFATVMDGTTNEEVLEMLIDRLQSLHAKLPNAYTDSAIMHCQSALQKLEARTAERKARKVEGTPLAALILFLGLSLLIGCTARGGWPRFLRPGEASDGAIRREQLREREATTNFLKGFEARREHAYDLETLGKDIVHQCGKVAAERAMYQLWWSWEPQTFPSNACNMAFVITREPKVQDLAWMICYRTNWLK